MSRIGALLAAAVVMSSGVPVAVADVDGAIAPERHPRDTTEPSSRVSAWTHLRAGKVEAPYPSASLREVQSDVGQARLLRLGAAARVTEAAWVGAHAAYVFGGVEQPAGSYRAASVWGNPMLFARVSRADVAPWAGRTIDAELSLSLGLPVAAERGDAYEQIDRRALATGNALAGMRDPELFTPNVLPVAVGGSVLLPTQYVQLSLDLELPLLARLSDATIPDGASSSAIGVVPNGRLQAATWPWTWFGIGLGGAFAWPVVEPVYLERWTSAPQITLLPQLSFALGAPVLLTLDAAVAAGGPSAGTVSAGLGARLAL